MFIKSVSNITKCSSSVCAMDQGPRPPSTQALNCLIKVCSGFQVDYLLCDDYYHIIWYLSVTLMAMFNWLFQILFREEKKRFETEGDRTDAILLWNFHKTLLVADDVPPSIIFMVIKIYPKVGIIVIGNYELIYIAWLRFSDFGGQWLIEGSCHDFNIG